MLTRSSEYAIRAMVFIQLQNWQNKRPLIVDIAKEIEAPQAFTAKILQTLTKHNLILSMKGRGGGFFYPDELKPISLFDVINTIEGDRIFHKCGFGLKKCSDENPCPLHDQYKDVRERFYQIVKQETIHSLSLKIFEGKAVLNRFVNLN